MKLLFNKNSYILFLFSISFALFSQVTLGQDEGKELYKNNCASCHKIDGESTGPALQGAKGRWEAVGEGGLIYEWVQNNQSLRASGKSKRAETVFNEYNGENMNPFPQLSVEQIDAILDYADTYVPPTPDVVAEGVTEKGEEGGNATIWLIVLVLIFAVVFFSAISVRKKIAYITASQKGEEVGNELTAFEKFGAWVYKNWLFSLIIFVFLLFAGLTDLFSRAYQINQVEDYQPSQFIEYSHKLHAGDMGIDCRYCHNSVEKSKHAGLPTTNVCMNCHRMVHEGPKTGKKEIAKIHASAGYNVDIKDYNRDSEGAIIEGKPMVWNKAHNMPDHVFFSHKQHVNVGKVDCKQCHGDVATYTLGRVSTLAEINELAKTDKSIIPLTKPLMSMGWCIECHEKKEIDVTGSGGYYEEIHKRLTLRPDHYKKIQEDGTITVKELGGWECAKCHY